MSVTSQVKDELARTPEINPSARKAEVSAMMRFGGVMNRVGGRMILETTLDSEIVAHRLRAFLVECYGARAEIIKVDGRDSRKAARFLVRVVRDGETLAHRIGLLNAYGQPILGLPPHVVSGSRPELIGAIRGAFLAGGNISLPGRSPALEWSSPNVQTSMGLSGAIRRLGYFSKCRTVGDGERVTMREGDDITAVLTLIGADKSLTSWQQRLAERARAQHEVVRLANFDTANLRRSAGASALARARVARAFEILGDQVPTHLIEAGKLRLAHHEEGLEELGRLATPPMTKDAMAGRIRRLISTADRRAAELGIPNTDAHVTEDMLAEAS